MNVYKITLFVLLFLVSLGFMVKAENKSVKRFDISQRIACLKTIENVKQLHRIWPKENTKPKPDNHGQLGYEQIRTKVEKILQMEEALYEVYGIEITPAMLQVELERMASTTKAPDRLQELFNALGNDPVAAAECIALPILVKSKLYENYAWDKRQHGALKTQAELAIAGLNGRQSQVDENVRKYRVILVRKENVSKLVDVPVGGGDGIRHIELDKENYSREVMRLTGSTANQDELAATQNRQLRETENAFVYEEVLSRTHDSIEVLVSVWQKQGVGSWLASRAQALGYERQSGDLSGLYLPNISLDERASVVETSDAGRWGNLTFPAGRLDHTAIWTGVEMIVWGGGGWFGPYLNSGSRYDPTTDIWTHTSTSNAPSPRHAHSAIWTGSEMIIWGGEENFRLPPKFNSGGRYNPSTDTWTTTSISGAPPARSYHTAVWSGSEMIIWGGTDENNQMTPTGGRYNPSTDTWTTTSNLDAPQATNYHTAVWTGVEMIVWGGEIGFYLSNTGGRYNPASDSWAPTTTIDAPDGRGQHTAIWTGSEMIVWGGSYKNTGGRYNPNTDSWTATTTIAPEGRGWHTAIWTGDEMIIWGGLDRSGYELNDGARYDPSRDIWTPTNSTNSPVLFSGHTAIWTGNEMIIWGGLGLDASPISTGARYDPLNDAWKDTSATEAFQTRSGAGVWTGSEVIVWGGSDLLGFVNTGGRYDIATDSWEAISKVGAPSARGGHKAIWTGSKMVIWGGYAGLDEGYTEEGALYDPISDSWTPTSIIDAPIGREGHTAIWAGSEMIVWGGRQAGSGFQAAFYTGGRYNPVSDSWTETNEIDAPTERFGHTAVWTGSEMIVWGGGDVDGSRYYPSTDSWEPMTAYGPDIANYQTAVWTGSDMILWGGVGIDGSSATTGGRYNLASDTWTTIAASDERRGHTAIWTGSEMIVWGGESSGRIKNTGGRYDPAGNHWAPTTIDGAPNGRAYHFASWTGNEMIVWGGGRGYGIYYPYGIRYTVASSTSSFGSINPSSLQLISEGDTTQFDLSPDVGFEVSEAFGCNGLLNGNTYVTGPITKDCMVAVSFVPINTICAPADTFVGPAKYLGGEVVGEQAEGYIATEGNVFLESGATVVFEATKFIELNRGFHIDNGGELSIRVKPTVCPDGT